jgi:hypothetical protein
MSERDRGSGMAKPARDLTSIVAVLFLATAVAGVLGCGPRRQEEALAMFDVVADTPVPAFTTFCFSVATRPDVRTHHLVAPSSRRMTFGYYLPGPAGHVQIRGQALTVSGEVVGEGLADVDIELGRTSDLVPLVVGGHDFTRSWCTAGVGADASPDGGIEDGSDDGRSDDGEAEDLGDSAHAPYDASDDTPSDAQVDSTLDTAADGSHDAGADGQPDARADTASDVAVDAPVGSTDAAVDAPVGAPDAALDAPVGAVDAPADGRADAAPPDMAVDRPTPCTACTAGEKRTETETCGPCRTGKRSRTLTCSTTCTWTGDWGACTDPAGTAANGCSIVDWCTRKAAPECKQKACTTAQALAECRTEAKTVCGSNSPAPTITYCN